MATETVSMAEGAVAHQLLPVAKARMDELTQGARESYETSHRCSRCGHRESDKEAKRAVRVFRVTFGNITQAADRFARGVQEAAAGEEGLTPAKRILLAQADAAKARQELEPLQEWLAEQELTIRELTEAGADPAELEEARGKFQEQAAEAQGIKARIREAVEREGLARSDEARAFEAALAEHLPDEDEQQRIRKALWPEYEAEGEQPEAEAAKRKTRRKSK